jgi:hypothetical protein
VLDAVLFDKLDKLKLIGEAEISFYNLGVNSKKKSKVGGKAKYLINTEEAIKCGELSGSSEI